MKIRIYYHDTDAQGIVYHANYLKFCEQARSEFVFANLGKDAFDATSYFVVAQINARFKGAARLGDDIEVLSKCENITDISLELRQDILLEGKVIFTAYTKLVYLKNAKLSKIPEKFKELFISLK